MLTRARLPRPGFTLVELLVALTLTAVVVAAIARSRGASQSATTDALATAEARRQLRAGSGAVLATLRGAAPASGDLLALSDSALELRVTLGASVACAVSRGAIDAPPSLTIAAPGQGTTPDSVLAGWHDAPAPGDALLVLVHNDPADSGAVARWRWESLPVAGSGVATTARCLHGAPIATMRLPLARAPGAGVVAGAAVRLLRRGRWSVYRSRGRWYLGWRDVAASGVALDAVQPVSGPHDLRDARGNRRASLSFAPALALPTAATATMRLDAIAGIGIQLATPTVRATGAERAESLAVAVAFRNGAAP